MDRKPLYAQFDGDDVDGKIYKLGDELAEGTDAGTRAYLTSTGRFSATPPNSQDVHSYDTATDVGTMDRIALLNELAAGQSDDVLRDAVERKREHDADKAEADRQAVAEAEAKDPLNGNADKAIDYINASTDAAELATLKDRETNGDGRKGVLAALDKRVASLAAA